MKQRLSPSAFALLAGFWVFFSAGTGFSDEDRPPIPEDLIGDEHIREEFGVNEFTTPSIRRVFEHLEVLGKMPYDEVKRKISQKTPVMRNPAEHPEDRILVALGLGVLIADGFLIVHSEKFDELEEVGRALLKYAEALGTGTRIKAHSRRIIEHSVLGDWGKLKEALAAAQADVEAEMVLLRDVEIAHLIALAGWLRAFEIAVKATSEDYSEEKAGHLARADVAGYFVQSLETLHPRFQELDFVRELHAGLKKLQEAITLPEGTVLSKEQVAALQPLSTWLVDVVVKRLPK